MFARALIPLFALCSAVNAFDFIVTPIAPLSFNNQPQGLGFTTRSPVTFDILNNGRYVTTCTPSGTLTASQEFKFTNEGPQGTTLHQCWDHSGVTLTCTPAVACT